MTARTLLPEEFQSVVAFHGCYCLDIAVGYRVTKALMREMGDDMRNLKQVVAYTGAPTCAVDAIQQLAGCTLGKRNLHYTNTGKSTFVLHNTVTGKAVRAYCHYWDHYDHDALRRCRQAASGPDATPSTNRPCRRCSTRMLTRYCLFRKSPCSRWRESPCPRRLSPRNTCLLRARPAVSTPIT